MIINGEDEVIVVWRSEVHYCQVITTSILSVDTVENTNYFNHLIGILVIQDSNSGDRASLEAEEWYDRLEYPEYLDCQLCGEVKLSFELGDSMANTWLSPDDDPRPHRFCLEVCLELVTSYHCYSCNLMFDPYETKTITEYHSNFDDTYSICSNCHSRLSAFDFKRYKQEKMTKKLATTLYNDGASTLDFDEEWEF